MAGENRFERARGMMKREITETERTQLVLSGMQNRTFGPYLAAINRILMGGDDPPNVC
jgi:hypothetical protein